MPGFEDARSQSPGSSRTKASSATSQSSPKKARPQPNLKVELSYSGRKQPVLNGLQRVSKPGLRVYVQRREIPRVYGGLGIAILSTPKGVMTGQEARRNEVGGEVLCYVW